MQTSKIIDELYSGNAPLKRILIEHSRAVAKKALEIANTQHPAPVCWLRSQGRRIPNIQFVEDAAMLHDIGIIFCDAPGIECHGPEPYICHGILGARYLREHAEEWGMSKEEIEPYARVCERHTGAGLTAKDIREQNLPLPEQDYLPETMEEKLICYADKFFSKTRLEEEKTIDRVLRSMEKFGTETTVRFNGLHRLFG